MSELRAFRRPSTATADAAEPPLADPPAPPVLQPIPAPDAGFAAKAALVGVRPPVPEFDDESDARLDFQSEVDLGATPATAAPPPAAAPVPARKVRPAIAMAAGVMALAVAVAGVYVAFRPAPGTAAVPAPATVTLMSNLEGAEVSIDGTPRGTIPLKIALAAGTHTVEVHQGSRTRSMPLTVEAGAVVSHYVELAPAEAAPITGRLEITTETPGAQVSVDGEVRGVTPLSLSDIPAGRHRVQVANGDARVSRTVDVPAGAMASVMVALAAPAGVSGGWLSVPAPFELQVFEDGQLLGTSTADRLMLAAGRHTLDFVNTSLEFKARQTIDVPAGKTLKVALAVPNGSLSVNALPWADVTLDGRPIGTTPLGNMSVPVGTHEVVWRHPQLGERRRTIAVTASSAVRVGMDFSK